MSFTTLRNLLLLFLLSIGTLVNAKVHLVSVGIADYPGTVNDLNLCANDAKKIAYVYSKNNAIEYRLLTNSEATTTNILNAMNSVFAKAGVNDIVVFFFSGHGYQGGFCAYDGNLDYGKIRNAMAKSQSKNKMIFADACFSGKIRTEGKDQNSVNDAKKANVMLFLSSRGSEISIESANLECGFFTTYLQNGLRGKADANRDRTITAKELFNYVSQGVKELSNDTQHPVMWGNFSDNMPVIVW